jgi:hypothetical protein
MEPMTRGLVIKGFAAYLERHCNDGERDRVRSALSPDVRIALVNPATSRWYPRSYFVELNCAIASLHTQEADVLEALSAAGRNMAEIATGTFMKLLLKLLTPALFARKFSDFWAHDNRGGRIDVDSSKVDEKQLDFWIREVRGFDHVGPVGRGYIQFAMSAITGSDVSVKLENWSLTKPGPEEVHYDVSW